MSQYVYKKLDPVFQEFRVLLLKPATRTGQQENAGNNLVECELVHRRLGEETDLPFKAVSYCWGDPTRNYRIKLDGAIVSVTESLGSFLRRQKDESEAEQLLWADALCINQDDDDEKTHQIALMRAIYGSAAELLIWLGDMEEQQCSPLDLVVDYSDNIDTSLRPKRLTGEERFTFNSVLTMPWFDRVWIVQELLLGVRTDTLEKTHVILGSTRVPWTKLINSMLKLTQFNLEDREHFPSLEKALALEKLRKAHAYGSQQSLLWWLSTTRNRIATDARDNIYGVMGLVNSSDPLLMHLPREYSVSAAQLYVDLATAALQSQDLGLNILRHCQYQELPDLPSWVPDWSTPTRERPLFNFLDIEDADPEPVLDYVTVFTEHAIVCKEVLVVPEHYQAGSNASPNVSIDFEKQTLTVEGILLGKISLAREPFMSDLEEEWYNSTGFMVQVSSCKSLIESLPPASNPYHSTLGRQDAFWRTLLTDHDGPQDYHPLLSSFPKWLPPIPPVWEPEEPHISQTSSGRLWQLQLAAMRLRYSFADFLKRNDRTISEKTWADFIPKGFETPILRETPDGEKDLLLDATHDSWWEELLSINSDITVPALRRYLEETLDSQWFDQARSNAVDEFKGTREELLSIHRDLAELWMDGPPDLIGSPFRLPSVIPDPFSRHRDDRGTQFEVTELHPALKAVQFQTDPRCHRTSSKQCRARKNATPKPENGSRDMRLAAASS